ncbi:MAG TPA: tetratricopeptide repeat protein [Phycisphaerales bacterium]|nr:tetratricopeptide repeat protein [Phycisphaerales bacterium]
METPEGHIRRGWAMIDVHRHASAVDCFSSALALAPRNSSALGGLAIALSGAGRHDKAIKAARQCVAAAPDQPWNHYVLGWVLSAAGQHRRAIVNLDRAVAMAPHHAHSWSERASCYYSIGEYHKAERDAEEAVRLDPNSADALNALGLALYYGGYRKRAQAVLYHCRALHPGDARTHANIGWVSSSEGLHEESAESFRRALELSPAELRWVGPLIASARRRLWWFTTLRNASRSGVVAVVVIVLSFSCPMAVAAALDAPKSESHVVPFITATCATLATTVLALSAARSALGRLIGCIDPYLRSLTPPGARAAGAAAAALIASQAVILIAALGTNSPGAAWLSVLPCIVLIAVCGTQQPAALRTWVEASAGALGLAWAAYGAGHGATRLWTLGGVLLLGLAWSRLARLRRRLTPPAGVPSLH